MANRKEERERLRAERLAAERAAGGDERRRLILGYFIAGLLGAVVIVGIVVAVMNSGGGAGEEAEANEAAGIDPNTGAGGLLVDLEPDEREGTPPPPVEQADLELAAEAADCELHLDLEDEGNTHIEDDAKTPDYGTDPPTSGDHSPENVPDGAYLDTPELRNSVHSLEHGRVEIQYDPALSEDEQLALKGLFDSDPQGMLLFPNPDMKYEVAATTWTNMITCDSYNPEVIDALRAFRDVYRGQGPESVPF
jgi:hypothetical protein